MSKIAPCLWLDGQAEQAAALYLSVFGGSTTAVSRYGEDMHGPVGAVLMVELDLAGQRVQILNGGPMFAPNPSVSCFAHADDADETRRRFDALAPGGSVLMPLDAYPWSPCYAWVQDRFGVSWQLITGRRPASGATIVPCLMFSAAQHGRAEEALRAYSALFPESSVDSLEPYAPGEGPEGTLKHGRFTLAGQPFVAMDSHYAHDITFSEGVSLAVRCADQAEVDRLWAALGDGGRPGPCGWLVDRFGLSWQIVPERLSELFAQDDREAIGRMFHAMLPMGCLDLAALEAAYHGTTG